MIDSREQQLVERLAAEGLIIRRRFRPARAVALISVLACAFWLGGLWSLRSPSASSAQRYVLLLYEGPRFQTAASGRAAEYAAWAHAPHPSGKVVGGEELTGEAMNLGPAVAGVALPAGYFIVEAEDRPALLRLAGSCPHLRHGGSIAIRALAG